MHIWGSQVLCRMPRGKAGGMVNGMKVRRSVPPVKVASGVQGGCGAAPTGAREAGAQNEAAM